ncbi:hypothetical protein BDK51DRAFT_19343, partial [Blyttiomyces helicus]
SADTPANLFRRNSMATRLLTLYAKSRGEEYLRLTLQPLLLELVERCPPMSFEVDPIKLTPRDDPAANLRNLKLVAQGFLDSIIGNASRVPRGFREACALIFRVVGGKFPEARVTAVGGFVFLRFFCPAIVAPESHNLVAPSAQSKELRRGLVLITKVVQNLANNVLFGIKESFMAGLNDFLRDNIGRVHGFLRDISVGGCVGFDDPRPEIGITDVDMMRLHHSSTPPTTAPPAPPAAPAPAPPSSLEPAMTRKKAFAKLSTLLAQLGPAPEVSRLELAMNRSESVAPGNHPRSNSSGGGVVASQMFLEFMARVEGRAGSAKAAEALKERKCFFEGGVSKERRPVLYYISRRVIPDAMDMELVIYFILLKLKPHMTKPFDLVVDATQFSGENEWPLDWLQRFEKLLPVDVGANFHTLFIYNANTVLRKYAKRASRLFGSKIAKRTLFLASLQEFGEHISASDLRLPKSTIALERDVTSVFSPAFRLSTYRQQVPVVLRITPETLHIREAIVQAIRAAKARFLLSRPSNVGADRRHLRPSDVPGTLLNMALLNLGSDDANLRLASYNLLCALGSSFEFDVVNQLLTAKGLCIPSNNQDFVISISRRLAETEHALTLEFLLESIIGFSRSNKELKHFCLEYMTPWIPNLALFARPAPLMIESTMFPLIQSRIWSTLGKVEELVPTVLDAFLQTAIESGLGSQQNEVLANTVITLASVNVHLVSGKIISRLRRAINCTSTDCTASLVDHPAWGEISVLIRFVLMLSFNDRLNVCTFLPELFHIVSMLVGIGTPILRSSVHGITINIVQTLCTRGELDDASLSSLRLLLADLSDPKMCAQWTSNTSSLAFLFTSEALSGEVARHVPLGSLEAIVNTLLEVMSNGAADPELSATWMSRWMSLIASTAFQYNPSIQPRAFVALGCLARNDVDDDLLYQILIALRGALTLFEDNESHLIVSIIMSLCSIVGGLPKDSRYLPSMFWLAMGLIQIGHVPIFHSALSLLLIVLRTLDAHGCFLKDGVAAALMRARKPIEEAAARLDLAVGIQFTTDFAFAASANLLKGLKHASTKTATTAVLSALLEITTKHSRFGASGGASRPDATDAAEPSSPAIDPILPPTRVGRDRPPRLRKVLDRLDLPDSSASMLAVSLMVTMLENADYETEVLFIYAFLAEAAVAIPDVFAVIYDSLLPRMTIVLATSQTLPVMEAVQTILKTMVAASPPAVPSSGHSPTASPGHSPPSTSHRRSAPPSSSTAYSSSPPPLPPPLVMGQGPAHVSNVPHFSSSPIQSSPLSSFPSPSMGSPYSSFGGSGGSHPTAREKFATLTDLGFSGLPGCGSFQSVPRGAKVRLASSACALVDAVVGL